MRPGRRPAAAGGLVVGYWHIKMCRLFLHWVAAIARLERIEYAAERDRSRPRHLPRA